VLLAEDGESIDRHLERHGVLLLAYEVDDDLVVLDLHDAAYAPAPWCTKLPASKAMCFSKSAIGVVNVAPGLRQVGILMYSSVAVRRVLRA